MDVAELMVEEVEPSPKATALPETAGTVEERRTVPKGPPPSTMEELLTRAGVENNYLAMSQEEIKDLFESLSYEQARVAAREVVDARRKVREYLAAYEGTPEYVRLTTRSYLAYLAAITFVLREAAKAGDTELQAELALAG